MLFDGGSFFAQTILGGKCAHMMQIQKSVSQTVETKGSSQALWNSLEYFHFHFDQR